VRPPLWRAAADLIRPIERGGLEMQSAIVRHVLIVDDNVSFAENIAEILEIYGHTTRIAGSAEQAFPSGREYQPDIVVTDYRLPGISGPVFVRQFLATHARVRAMVISAYTDAKTIDAATEAGAAFMAKPLDFTLLERWVADAPASTPSATRTPSS
jgi:DNA-binding NtrC family response regulator